MRRIKTLVVMAISLVAVTALAFADVVPGQVDSSGYLKTGVVSQDNTSPAAESWRQFLTYHEGESEYAKDILTGVAVIEPGRKIHPPHKHVEEEFLMILEGGGTWTIGMKNIPANAGGIMYSEPGELHGLLNSGDAPLKFTVFKYNQKNKSE